MSDSGIMARGRASARIPGSINDAVPSAVCRGSQGLDDDATARDELAGGHLSVLFLDLDYLAGFIRSVAVARASQANVSTKWVSYDESKVINAIYMAMPWKGKPGTVEVEFGSQQAIEADTRRFVRQYQATVMAAMDAGPQALARKLEHLDQIRKSAWEALQDTLRDAGNINSAIVDRTGEGIRRLALIKLVADLTMTALGVVLSGPGATVLGAAYSVGGASLAEASAGKPVAGVAIVNTAKTGGGMAANAAKSKALDKLQVSNKELVELEQEIAKREQAIARRMRKHRKYRHLNRQVRKLRGRAGEVEGQARKLGRASGALKVVSWAFVAESVYSAFSSYQTTVASSY